MTLRPIKSGGKTRQFSVYDLEWYPHTLELRLIGVYDEKGYRSYQAVSDFLNAELTYESRGRWFYAHAGGLFDLRFILEYLADELPRKPWLRVKAAFSGSSAIIVTIQRGADRWYFVDSFWLIRQSLRKIGTWMGKDKGGRAEKSEPCRKGQTVDGRVVEECTCDPVFFAPMAELEAYNELDCEILHDAIEFMQSSLLELGGRLEKTIASSALSLFKRAYLSREIQTHDDVNLSARSAYVASRVEVLDRECSEGDYYDVNSSFPYAMTFDAPGNVVCHLHGRLPKGESPLYLAEATVTAAESDLPPLPYRSERGRLYFPTGTWSGWFMGEDLQLLERTGGRIESVGTVVVFEPFDDLRGYAEDIYGRRVRSSSEAERQVLKILLNSLYGKFAESEKKVSLLLNPPSTVCPHSGADGFPMHDSDGIGNSCFTYLTAGVWTFSDERKVPHAHVPISAHITAVARRVLYDYMQKAPHVYYCDTDGFATTRQARFDVSTELGGLKHEKKIRRGRFLAPKLYALEVEDEAGAAEWMVKAKGFGGGISYADFCELAERAEDDDWAGLELNHFERIREGFGRGSFAPAEGYRHKRFRAQGEGPRQLLPKRRFFRDGSSAPWSVAEIAERKG